MATLKRFGVDHLDQSNSTRYRTDRYHTRKRTGNDHD